MKNKMNAKALLELIKPALQKPHALNKELIVSLTSYSKRFNILPYSIQSILNQSVTPDRIILWLHKSDYNFLPVAVTNLVKLGLEIRFVDEDWRSYKKIIPTLLKYPDCYVVTCDDDIIYKPTLLEDLVTVHLRVGGIIAHRAHLVQIDQAGNLLPYSLWLQKTPARDFCEINSPLVFPTSGGGTLYPPNCFVKHVVQVDRALKLSPTADDAWLFFMASHKGTRSSLIGNRGLIDINPNKGDSLWASNRKGENDKQIKNIINEFGMPASLKSEIIKARKFSAERNAVKLINGKSIRVKNDHIGRIIRSSELYYENKLISYIKRRFCPRRVIDVGANIGNHALGFSGAPGYKVLCFEPDKEIAKIAKYNLSCNSVEYSMFTIGLGARDENVPFIPASSGNLGAGRFDKCSKSQNTLRCRPMDDCVPDNFDADLIKIDVEGFEPDVLIGAINTIKRCQPVLVVEHHDYKHYKECIPILSKLGYRPEKVFGATPTFIYLRDSKINGAVASPESWVDCWQAFINRSK